jgi:hypothetical protein
VVGDVPFVSPVKNAEAIEQKNMFEEATSVKGSVVFAPPHVPVSARIRLDVTLNTTIPATNKTARRLIC